MESTKEDRIQVVLCEPGKKARVTTIMNRLEALQQMVGGFIEAVYPYEDPVAIVCNEEGKLEGLPLNRALRGEDGNVYDIIAGPFIVVGLNEDNFGSLSKEHQEKYLKLFKHPEEFFRVGNKIQAVVVEPTKQTHSPKRR